MTEASNAFAKASAESEASDRDAELGANNLDGMKGNYHLLT